MIKLFAPAQQAKAGPPLSPILGQHQIKVAEFVTRFNEATSMYTPGTPLGVRILKINTTQWNLQVLPPRPGTLVKSLQLSTPGLKVDRKDLWGVLNFYNLHQTGEHTPQEVRILLGTLKSFGKGLKIR